MADTHGHGRRGETISRAEQHGRWSRSNSLTALPHELQPRKGLTRGSEVERQRLHAEEIAGSLRVPGPRGMRLKLAGDFELRDPPSPRREPLPADHG
jgi:hypothetical protein